MACTGTTAQGFVIISETDVSCFVLGRSRTWGTLPHIQPQVFALRADARRHLFRHLSGGAALSIPGGRPRIISARAAGVER